MIILSGYDQFSYAQQGIRLGVLDYLLKPVDRDELFMVLRDAAERAAQSCVDLEEETEKEAMSMAEQAKRILEASFTDSEVNLEWRGGTLARQSFFPNEEYAKRIGAEFWRNGNRVCESRKPVISWPTPIKKCMRLRKTADTAASIISVGFFGNSGGYRLRSIEKANGEKE